MDERRVIICGSRTWNDSGLIRKLLEVLPKGTTVVAGGAKGADRIAEVEARRMEIPVEVYPAKWDEHGKSAGYRRNERMLELDNVTHVFAFRKGEVSKGTDHMISLAKKAGAYTKVVAR